MNVLEGSDDIGEVIRRGGPGYKYVINLNPFYFYVHVQDSNYIAGFIVTNLNPYWLHVYDANCNAGFILINLNPCWLHVYDTGMLLTLRR